MLLAAVRAEFRAAAPAGPPLSGAALAAAEATAGRTFEARPSRSALAHATRADTSRTLGRRQFVRRAVFHGGTERTLLRNFVHHADDWARRPTIACRASVLYGALTRRGAGAGRGAAGEREAAHAARCVRARRAPRVGGARGGAER